LKRLYIIRHAKSSWGDSNLKDFDRPLNKRGSTDAPLMGEVLRTAKVEADLIISSPAKRAITTAKIIAEAIDYKKAIEDKKEVYGADTQIMLNVVNQIDNKIKTLFIFGHNPTFTYFAEMLSEVNIGNLPTTGIVGIEFDFDDWALVSSNTGNCFYYDYPKNHK